MTASAIERPPDRIARFCVPDIDDSFGLTGLSQMLRVDLISTAVTIRSRRSVHLVEAPDGDLAFASSAPAAG
jgi:hypothetical protein